MRYKLSGVRLVRVNKVENPNYVFLDLEIAPSAKAGSFPIIFSGKTGKAVTYTYVLNGRDKTPNRIQGVTSQRPYLPDYARPFCKWR